MSLEFWNTVGSLGTLVVLAATGIAALSQLRHMRGSNQIAALTECRETLESADFQAARHFVAYRLPELLENPADRVRFANRPLDLDLRSLNYVGNFYESMGSFVKHGIIDKAVACDLWSGIVIADWDALEPFTAISRRAVGSALWENFEYMSVLSEDWNRAHPTGTYPAGVRRRKVEDTWLAADSSAPAGDRGGGG